MSEKKYHVETSKTAHLIIKREVDFRNKTRAAGDPLHTFESVSHEIITRWNLGLAREGGK